MSEFLDKEPPGTYGRIHRDLEYIWEYTTITNFHSTGETTSLICHDRYVHGHVLFEYDNNNGVLSFGDTLRDFQLMHKLDYDFLLHVIKDRTYHLNITVRLVRYFNFKEFEGMYQSLIQRKLEKELFTTEPVTIYDSEWGPKEESIFSKLVNKIRRLF